MLSHAFVAGLAMDLSFEQQFCVSGLMVQKKLRGPGARGSHGRESLLACSTQMDQSELERTVVSSTVHCRPGSCPN